MALGPSAIFQKLANTFSKLLGLGMTGTVGGHPVNVEDMELLIAQDVSLNHPKWWTTGIAGRRLSLEPRLAADLRRTELPIGLGYGEKAS